jgi:16S rRNA G1207 methylase RsmC
VTALDINEDAVAAVHATEKQCIDFMSYRAETPFNLVVMNPPFTKSQDAKHVLRAITCVKTGGCVYTILPPSWKTKTSALYRELQTIPSDVLGVLPAGTFEDTKVTTEMVRFF